MERNGSLFGTERNGTVFCAGRSGTERNGTDFCSGRSGTEPNPQMSTPIPKMAASQRRLHQNSGQNRPVEGSTALTGTIFVTISVFRSRGNFWAAFGQHLGNTIFYGTERNGLYGADFFSERNGTDFTERILFWNGTERILRNGFLFWNGTERNGSSLLYRSWRKSGKSVKNF